MTTTEHTGILKYVDDDGNVNILYPEIGKTISKADFDALPEEERNRGIYWVPDAESSGGGSNIELDKTLTVEGKAADAKAVGDAISVRWNSESDYFEVLQNGEWVQSVVIAGVKEEVIDLNLDTRTLGTPSSTGSDASTSRTFDTSTYVIGLAKNNMYNSSYVSNVSFTEDSITQTAGGGFGTSIPLELEPNGTYELSCTTSVTGSYAGAMFYNSSGSFIGVEGNHTDDNLTLPFTVPSNAKYSVLLFTASFSNIKLIKK